MIRSATPSARTYDAFDGPPALVVPGWVLLEDVDDQLGDLVELVVAEAAGGQRRGAEADAGGVPGAVGVGRDRVAVGDDAGVEQGRLGLPAGEAERRDVEQHDVVVGAAGDQRARRASGSPRPATWRCRRSAGRRCWNSGCRASASATALAAIMCESGPPSTIGQPRSTDAAYSSCASTSPPRGPRSDLWVVVVVTWACGTGSSSPVNTLPATRPGEVGHVDHQRGADLVGDLAHLREVRPGAGTPSSRPPAPAAGTRGPSRARRRSRAARSRGRCRTAAGGTSCR